MRWALAGLLFIATLGLTVYYYPELPEEIPTHFCADGTVNGWGPKNFFAFVPNGIQAISGAIFFLIHLVLSQQGRPAPENAKIFGIFKARQKPTPVELKPYVAILIDGIMFLLFTTMFLVQYGIIQVALNSEARMGMAPAMLAKLLIAWSIGWAAVIVVKGVLIQIEEKKRSMLK